ncbi:hypothetical protein BLX87_09920 [Bacillus sp. VT-16-64]|nr:hypothetical protein BLX87_09920 [Bacillus sp. VT-16-64]
MESSLKTLISRGFILTIFTNMNQLLIYVPAPIVLKNPYHRHVKIFRFPQVSSAFLESKGNFPA